MEISTIADDTIKFERIIAQCACIPMKLLRPAISSWAGNSAQDVRMIGARLLAHQ